MYLATTIVKSIFALVDPNYAESALRDGLCSYDVGGRLAWNVLSKARTFGIKQSFKTAGARTWAEISPELGLLTNIPTKRLPFGKTLENGYAARTLGELFKSS